MTDRDYPNRPEPPTHRLIIGDVRDALALIPDQSVQCAVTSPPYFGLRSYLPEGHPNKQDEIGAERSLDEYIANLVAVFREVRRCLRDDGTLWLNLGDSYAANWNSQRDAGGGGFKDVPRKRITRTPGFKPKDLMMVPARVAIALVDDGWYLRSDIIWHKTAPMPESVTDRPTSAHEHIFLLTKRPKYFYDQEAVREASTSPERENKGDRSIPFAGGTAAHVQPYSTGATGYGVGAAGRNQRNVWTLSEPMYRLRGDLTPEQRAYVFARLAAQERRGLS